MIANLLSIAGSDPSGGAGIQADLKTFSAFGCYGMAVLTALTAQNTKGVTGIHVPPAAFLRAQIDAIYADIRVDGVKIGMLASGELVRTAAECLERHGSSNVVLDPVLVATSGDSLGSSDVVEAILATLLPKATLVTPNLFEASRLSGLPVPTNEVEMKAVAERIHARGAQAVLVKGGHLGRAEAVDVLFDGRDHTILSADRVETPNTHGTGCTLSSGIAACLAQGASLIDAISDAKDYLTEALVTSAQLRVGRGHGPVHHFHALWPEADDSRVH